MYWSAFRIAMSQILNFLENASSPKPFDVVA